MKDLRIHISVRILLFWYGLIFISTEFLSFFTHLTRVNILISQTIFAVIILYFFGTEIKKQLKKNKLLSKTNFIIGTILLLTFIQGLFSAPSTTDSMVYHLPKVMYWVQEKTVYQDVIRNPHDFKAPLAEYIVLHLYVLLGNDRLAFFSQWLAFAFIIYLSGIIAKQLGAEEKLIKVVRVFCATLPIAVMQSASTQVDLVPAVLSLIAVHISISLKEKFGLKKVLLFSLTIGLGFFTKATFLIYLVVPAFILFPFIFKFPKKALIIGILVLASIFLIQGRFFLQNNSLYGNFLGKHLLSDGSVLEYTNKDLNLQKIVSNMIKNLLIHIPFPVFSREVYQGIVFIHNILGLDINDPSITCCGTEFKVLSIIYPQEDIVSNIPHLFLIIFAGITLYKFKNKREIKTIYLASIVAFILFSAIIKWQPYHSRLASPILLTGTIASVLLIKNIRILNVFLIFSILLAISISILNVSRPYVSYSWFFNIIKQYSRPHSSIPEAFYLKPRLKQYFNAEFFWYEPYRKTVENMPASNETIKITFDVMDDFEYPLWILLEDHKTNFQVIPKLNLTQSGYLIKTSTKREEVKNFQIIECYKTEIQYGYSCLYKKLLD